MDPERFHSLKMYEHYAEFNTIDTSKMDLHEKFLVRKQQEKTLNKLWGRPEHLILSKFNHFEKLD